MLIFWLLFYFLQGSQLIFWLLFCFLQGSQANSGGGAGCSHNYYSRPQTTEDDLDNVSDLSVSQHFLAILYVKSPKLTLLASLSN